MEKKINSSFKDLFADLQTQNGIALFSFNCQGIRCHSGLSLHFMAAYLECSLHTVSSIKDGKDSSGTSFPSFTIEGIKSQLKADAHP